MYERAAEQNKVMLADYNYTGYERKAISTCEQVPFVQSSSKLICLALYVHIMCFSFKCEQRLALAGVFGMRFYFLRELNVWN
jgi:hypothetical protein